MKYPSEIAAELRAQGRKFSQNNLIKGLSENCTPIVKHGRTVIYEDNAVDVMLAIFPEHTPKPIVVEENLVVVPEVNRLIKIEMMMEAVCKSLDIIY